MGEVIQLQYRETPDEGERVRESWERSQRMAEIRARISEIARELHTWNLWQYNFAKSLGPIYRLEVKMLDDAPEVMTMIEAAKLLKLHHRTVYNLVREGRFPATRVGKSWRVFKPDLIEWLSAAQKARKGESDEIKS